MGRPFKPDGYTSAAAYLVVNDARALITFLEKTFGAVPLRRYERPDGGVMHAEVRIDDTVVMLAEGNTQWPAYPFHLHVYVPDVDDVYRRALAAGGVAVQEPARKDGDPDRRGGVKDPSGNTWWVATQQ